MQLAHEKETTIAWLLQGDVAIQYQVYRDLFGEQRHDLQHRIAYEGWGKLFLAARRPNGHWGQKFYQPTWTSTHYTLLDLRNLCIEPRTPAIQDTLRNIVTQEKGPDGGIRPIGSTQQCDVCINGMVLNYATYFKTDASALESVVDFILAQHMLDGGFNCRLNRSGAVHSSLHTTLSVLEGIEEYRRNGYQYRLNELQNAAQLSREFILQHQFYMSDKSGQIIDDRFLRFSFPGRWRYDVLRALDYFQYANIARDPRMAAALQLLLKKRNKNRSWNLQAKHPGKFHFEMEKPGKPSRWNTLRALRVLRHFELDQD